MISLLIAVFTLASLATPASAAPTPEPTSPETPSATPQLDAAPEDPYRPPSEEELAQEEDDEPNLADEASAPVVQRRAAATPAGCPATFGAVGSSHTDGGYPISGKRADDGDGIPGTFLHHDNVVDTSYVYSTTRDPYLHLDGGWALGGSRVEVLADKVRPDMFAGDNYVVIVAGTIDNFTRYNVPPAESMQHMARLVENTGMPKDRILLVTIPPIRHLEQRIINYNSHLTAFARRNGIRVFDSHAMSTDDGFHWRRGYDADGVHWTPRAAAEVGRAVAHTLNDMSGCVRSEFSRQAAAGDLGQPTRGVGVGLRNHGKFQHFERGSVYVSNRTPTMWVRGRIHDEWASLGWENGYPGYPTEPERCGLVRGGCYSVFERSAIYWAPATGAVEINGSTRDRWGRLGWERGWLGYPTRTKYCGLTRGGCLQRFEGGVMYWTSRTGTHAVRGKIFEHWGTSGWERGHLGYPTTDENCGLRQGGCFTHFQGGSIYWSPGTGAHTVKGRIKSRWAAGGWERGRLGYPVTNERCDRVGCTQKFQGGRMVFRWDTGKAVPHYR